VTWLWEGIATYEADQFQDIKQLSSMRSGQYPRFLSVRSTTEQPEIYALSYTAIEYIVHTWGMERVRELIIDKGDIGKVLGLTEDQFYENWYDFVKAKYLK
jgi:hypothetical protein